MALTVRVTALPNLGRINLTLFDNEHSTSTVEIVRRIPPTSRELPELAFISFNERHREVAIVDGERITSSVFDAHARATVPYEYRAREVFADGAIQDWSPWVV